MNKGMFYLLPFLALMLVAASNNALPRVEVAHLLLNIHQHEGVGAVETMEAKVDSSKPMGRNRNNSEIRTKLLKQTAGGNPIAGRNASRSKKIKKLIKRK